LVKEVIDSTENMLDMLSARRWVRPAFGFQTGEENLKDEDGVGTSMWIVSWGCDTAATTGVEGSMS
jgi:hypothetical protein